MRDVCNIIQLIACFAWVFSFIDFETFALFWLICVNIKIDAAVPR